MNTRPPLFAIEAMDETPPQQAPRPAPPPQPSRVEQAALSAIMLALKSLSQRALIAFAALANLAMVASVFWLFLSIPDPNPHQLIWGGIYALFVFMLIALQYRRPSQ